MLFGDPEPPNIEAMEEHTRKFWANYPILEMLRLKYSTSVTYKDMLYLAQLPEEPVRPWQQKTIDEFKERLRGIKP